MTDTGIRACFCAAVDDPSDPEEHDIDCLHAEVLRTRAFWDPQFAEAAANLRRMLWGPNRRPSPSAIPGGCYEASFGWVHVKPGCRCAH